LCLIEGRCYTKHSKTKFGMCTVVCSSCKRRWLTLSSRSC